MLYGLAYSGFGRCLRCCPVSRLSRLMYVGVVFGNKPCHVTQVALSSFCLPGLFNLSLEHRRYVMSWFLPKWSHNVQMSFFFLSSVSPPDFENSSALLDYYSFSCRYPPPCFVFVPSVLVISARAWLGGVSSVYKNLIYNFFDTPTFIKRVHNQATIKVKFSFLRIFFLKHILST